jgi:hypothetical protein
LLSASFIIQTQNFYYTKMQAADREGDVGQLDWKVQFHQQCADIYKQWNFWLLLPAKILPFLATSCLVISSLSINETAKVTLFVFAVIFTFVGGLLNVLNDMLDYGRKAVTQDTVAKMLFDLRLEISGRQYTLRMDPGGKQYENEIARVERYTHLDNWVKEHAAERASEQLPV